MSTPKVRAIIPYYVIEPGCSVSARYGRETPVDGETIIVQVLGQDASTLTINMDPETAVRMYGAIGTALKERDAHEEYRRQQDGAARCQVVAERI